MPPTRTTPSVVKKTERTHEENQERAYIAASRRSDRSLEARVESARRASEIHKKRTGRSLRITEQDVINEEMYEEEDDDLPLRYRLLQSHLRTGSNDFNRRYLAYMTSQLSMRSALDQAYAQYFPNYDTVVNNGSDAAMFFNMMPPQLASQLPQNIEQSAQSDQRMRSPPIPTLTRPGAPYPQPLRRTSSNTSVPQSPRSGGPADHNSPQLGETLAQSPRTNASSPSIASMQSPTMAMNAASFYGSLYPAPSMQPHQEQQVQAMMAQFQRQLANVATSPNGSTMTNPFSPSLPPNTQQFFNANVDPGDQFSKSILSEPSSATEPVFSPAMLDGHSLFEDSTSVFPQAGESTLAGSPTGNSSDNDIKWKKVKSQPASPADELPSTLDMETMHDDNWGMYMADWESVGGSQG